MYAIAGSGFGLYGYLPAVVEGLGAEVVLPAAAAEKIRARPELAAAMKGAHFVPTLEDAMDRAETLIIATPPARQVELVEAALGRPNIKRLVLEKPLAPTPREAMALLARIKESGKRCRVGYSLLETQWHADLGWPRRGSPEGALQLAWTFMAHHFAHGLRNWKRLRDEGGGVLRFFGIHVVALAAAHGYDRVVESRLESFHPGEPERWSAVFRGPEGPDLDVFVDSRSDSRRFSLGQPRAPAPLVELRDPFDLEQAEGEGDRRVGLLVRLLRGFDTDDASQERLYAATNALWSAAEGA